MDGCAILWEISWLITGTVMEFLNKFRKHLQRKLEQHAVFLTFGQYLF